MPTPPTSPSPEPPPASRRLLVGAALVGLAAASFLATRAGLARGDGEAELIAVQDVPADVRAELDVVWARFVERFPARTSCVDDVRVELVAEVEGGDARYVADRALIEIEIPTSPARFRESLAHELGHHVEGTCSDFAELRDALHVAFGPDRSWSGGDVWEETPSELWAEGVVAVVNGERVRHERDMPVDDAVVATIAAWGRGEPIG